MKITFKHCKTNDKIVFKHNQSISSKHIKSYINMIHWVIDDWLNKSDYPPKWILSFKEWLFKSEQYDLLCSLSQYQILLHCDKVHTTFDISQVSKGYYGGYNSLYEADKELDLRSNNSKTKFINENEFWKVFNDI